MKNVKKKPESIKWNGENWVKFSIAEEKYNYSHFNLHKKVTEGIIRAINYMDIRYLSEIDLVNDEIRKINF